MKFLCLFLLFATSSAATDLVSEIKSLLILVVPNILFNQTMNTSLENKITQMIHILMKHVSRDPALKQILDKFNTPKMTKRVMSLALKYIDGSAYDFMNELLDSILPLDIPPSAKGLLEELDAVVRKKWKLMRGRRTKSK